MAGRLATGLESLDRHLGHGLRDLRCGERPPVEPLRRDEEPRAGDDVGVARSARQDVERDVRPGPCSGRHRGAGRDQLDQAGQVVLAVLEPGPDEPEARPDTAEGRGDQGLRAAAVDEEDDAPVTGERRFDGRERPAEGGRLPAPRRADGTTGQRLQRQHGRRFPAEDPGGAPVRHRQPLLVRANRRLAEDQPDAAPAGAGSLALAGIPAERS